MDGVTRNEESSSTHSHSNLDSPPTVSTLEWTLPSKTTVNITVVNALHELIPSFVTPKHRSDNPNYLALLVTLANIDRLSWEAKIDVSQAEEPTRTVTKRMRDCMMTEIRLDSFIEGLSGMVHIHIEFLPVDDSLLSPIDITSRVLIVQGDRFEVSAEALALHSPYFESLFFGNFSEKNKIEIDIDGVTSDEFKRLLHTLTKGLPIEEDTVVELLLNSDRFDIPFVRDRCEDYLIAHEKRLETPSKSTSTALSTLLIFAQKFRLHRFTEYLISRMESITQVFECMQSICDELPIRSRLMSSLGYRIQRVPVRIRPEIFLDLSDTTDTWTERVTFELFADLCPTIVNRFIDYCQGNLFENGKRRHLRGTHISFIDVDSIECFPVEHSDDNPAYVSIPSDCDERNDLLPPHGCLIASRDSLLPLVDFPVTFGICLGNPFYPSSRIIQQFGRSPQDVVIFGKLVDNREAIEHLFYHSRDKTFMIGESQLSDC